MQKVTAIIYLSCDGKKFTTEKECLFHEETIALDKHHGKMVGAGLYKKMGFKLSSYLDKELIFENDGEHLIGIELDQYTNNSDYMYNIKLIGDKVEYKLYNHHTDELIKTKIVDLLK